VHATENSHLTPQCPGIGEACWLARDRIVSEAMMGGGAFILLKGGRIGPKSAKQVEIRLAILLKILQIARSGVEPSPARDDRTAIVFTGISAGYG
jgi:hypothetical protein